MRPPSNSDLLCFHITSQPLLPHPHISTTPETFLKQLLTSLKLKQTKPSHMPLFWMHICSPECWIHTSSLHRDSTLHTPPPNTHYTFYNLPRPLFAHYHAYNNPQQLLVLTKNLVLQHACLTPCPANFTAMSKASHQPYESFESKYRFRVLTIAVI